MLEWCPRNHKHKPDVNNEDNPEFESGIEQNNRNIKKNSSRNKDGTEFQLKGKKTLKVEWIKKRIEYQDSMIKF